MDPQKTAKDFIIFPLDVSSLESAKGYIELLADVNAQPPMGIEGVDALDKGKDHGGKLGYGALGIGGLKLKLHRECIAKMFESSEGVYDAEEIYALAKEMA